MATAYQVSQWIKAWHNAPSASSRQALCVAAIIPGERVAGEGEPKDAPRTQEGDDPSMEMEIAVEEIGGPDEDEEAEDGRPHKKLKRAADDDAEKALDMEDDDDADGEGEEVEDDGADVAPEVGPSEDRLERSDEATARRRELKARIADPVPKAREELEQTTSQPPLVQLLPFRQAVFNLPYDQTFVDLQDLAGPSPPPHPDLDISSSQVLNILFPDLPIPYSEPTLPPDGKTERRIDESSPHWSKISHVTGLMESKPLLVKTLQPAGKMRDSNWEDLSKLIGEAPRELHEARKEGYSPASGACFPWASCALTG